MSLDFDLLYDDLPDPSSGNPALGIEPGPSDELECDTPRPEPVGEDVSTGFLSYVFNDGASSGEGSATLDDDVGANADLGGAGGPSPPESPMSMLRKCRPELVPLRSSTPEVETTERGWTSHFHFQL